MIITAKLVLGVGVGGGGLRLLSEMMSSWNSIMNTNSWKQMVEEISFLKILVYWKWSLVVVVVVVVLCSRSMNDGGIVAGVIGGCLWNRPRPAIIC